MTSVSCRAKPRQRQRQDIVKGNYLLRFREMLYAVGGVWFCGRAGPRLLLSEAGLLGRAAIIGLCFVSVFIGGSFLQSLKFKVVFWHH